MESVRRWVRQAAVDGGTQVYGFDGAHRIMTVTDATGRVLLDQSYDTDGRVVRQTSPAGTTVELSYDDETGTTRVTGPPVLVRV